MPHVHMHALTQCCFHSLVSSQTFRRVLTALMDGCTEVKSLPSVALLILATFGGRVLEIKAWSGSVDIIGLAETVHCWLREDVHSPFGSRAGACPIVAEHSSGFPHLS